jgi:hypothetical protein
VAKHRDYYYCSTGFPGRGPKCGAKTIQLEAADKAVARMIAKEFSNAAFLKAVLAKLAANRPERTGYAQKLARERSKLEAQRERLVTLVVEGTLTPADFAAIRAHRIRLAVARRPHARARSRCARPRQARRRHRAHLRPASAMPSAHSRNAALSFKRRSRKSSSKIHKYRRLP